MMDRIALRTLLAAAVAGSLAAALDAAEPENSNEHIRYWVVQLGSDDYGTREEASVQLVRAGRAAIGPVTEGALQDDLEVASRSIQVLGSLLAADNAATEDAAAEVLGDFDEIRQQHAIDEIKSLGGSVLGSPKDGLRVILGAEWHGTSTDLALLKRVADLDWFSVRGVALTDDDLKYLEGLQRLEIVELYGTKVTAAGAARLAQLYPGIRIDRRGNAMLGVAGETVPLAGQQGTCCRITVVQPGSAADRGGLLAEDIIVKFQDQAVPDFETLTTLIGARAAGEKVTIELRRGEATLKKEVELGAWK
jgi:PDZ domain